MKLIILRHCKSAWDQPVADEERVLNERGRMAATALGDWMRVQGHIPDQALVSSATRTRETYELLNFDCPLTFHDNLYLSNPATMMAQLQASATGDAIIMVAHNPGIADFAKRLVKDAPADDDFERFPSGACLVAEGGTLEFGQFTTIDFIVPRQLNL